MEFRRLTAAVLEEEHVLGKPKYSLERIEKLLKYLESPHLSLANIVHVAGTNGKGSTIAYLRSILQAAGYRVHAYTSPHLLSINERIVLNGKPISSLDLNSFRARVRQVALEQEIEISFFEEITAVAFLAFKAVPSDLILCEVGLGGRLDATNVIANPLLSIITPISYDHEAILGGNLEQIAGEKAGIIKQGRPCVIGEQPEEIKALLESRCTSLGAACKVFGRDFSVSNVSCLPGALSCQTQYSFNFHSSGGATSFSLGRLNGRHQIVNAATALCAVQILAEAGYKITSESLHVGIEQAFWPARLESLNDRVTYDGAHNESGAQALAEWVLDTEKRFNLILGMSARKNATLFLKQLKKAEQRFDKVIFLPIESVRSKSVDDLIEAGKEVFDANLQIEGCASIKDAMKRVKNSSEVLICGSLYLASSVYQFFGANWLH